MNPLLIFLCLAQAASQDAPPVGRDRARVEQIGPARTPPVTAPVPAQPGQRNAAIGQLPPTLEAPNAPENDLVRPLQTDERRLYAEMAEVWLLIRQRGQQPTPDLIAREIGPEALATFLDQFPGAADMFGKDSPTLPIDDPGSADGGTQPVGQP